MAKLSKEELIAKINEKLADNSELAVELMEDVTDSFVIEEKSDEYKDKYDELLQKYKDRFMNLEEVKVPDKVEEVSEDKEEKVIDVEDIFEEKEEDKNEKN